MHVPLAVRGICDPVVITVSKAGNRITYCENKYKGAPDVKPAYIGIIVATNRLNINVNDAWKDVRPVGSPVF